MKKEFKATFVEGISNKFYTLRLEDYVLHRQWGRIGSEGQTKREAFISKELAGKEFERLKNSKLAKGYKENELEEELKKVSLMADEKYGGVTAKEIKVGDKVVVKGDSKSLCHHFSKGDVGEVVDMVNAFRNELKVKSGKISQWVDLEDLEIYDESCDY